MSESSKIVRCPQCGTITHKIEHKLFGKKKVPLTVEGKSLKGICLTCNGLKVPPNNSNVNNSNSDGAMKIPAQAQGQPQIQQAQPVMVQQQQQTQHIQQAIHNTSVIPGSPAVAAVVATATHDHDMPLTATPITAAVVRVVPQQQQEPQRQGVPTELLVKDRHADDATVVSAITLDHRLLDAPDDSDDEDYRVVPGQRRPEPSLGDPDEYERPAPLRRTCAGDHNYRGGGMVERERTSSSNANNNMTSNTADNNIHYMASMGPSQLQHLQQQNQMQQQPQQWMDQYHHPHIIPSIQERQVYEYDDHNFPSAAAATSGDIINTSNANAGMAPPTLSTSPQRPPSTAAAGTTANTYSAGFANRNIDPNANRLMVEERLPSIPGGSYTNGMEEEKAEIEASTLDGAMHTDRQALAGGASAGPPAWANSAAAEAAEAVLQKQKNGTPPSLQDIPALVQVLNASSSNVGNSHHTYHHTLSNSSIAGSSGGGHVMIASAIQSLADCVWSMGQPAKLNIIQLDGLEGLTQAMWAYMADATVQEAALQLIFALGASADADADSDVLIGDPARDVVDALLIVMNNHLTVVNIQHAGCGVLSCLAAASGNNPQVDDASLSGALMSVVSAMEAHRNSKGVQEWGVRALYNQCVHSRHSESNKRSLARMGIEDNKCGAACLYRAIEISEADMVTVEWACRLYWCLAASEDVAEYLTVTHHPIHVILESLQRYHQVPEAGGVLESIFGALANLVKVKENQKVVDSSVLYLVVKAAQAHCNNEDLLVEACALVANLVSLTRDNAAVAVNALAVDVIVEALQAFPDSAALFEEAMRSLACICSASDEAKRDLCTPANWSVLSKASSFHADSAHGQEMFVQLLSSFMVLDRFYSTIIDNGGLDMLLSIMKAHPHDRRVQEAASLALRNLACRTKENHQIDFYEALNLMTQAMGRYANSENIQVNGCCILWNVSSTDYNPGGYEPINDGEIIRYIVKAMQTHMESPCVQEMACGALCSKIIGSLEGKNNLIQSGGLDAVTCVLVMHLNESAALEKAFGVLSSMSAATEFADDVASAQCMSNVVEAMRANGSSIILLEFGCLVLRNIILVRPEHVSEASGVVATIINGMKEHPDAVGFQREACSLLWAMAAVSETCKSKVLSLDGIAVLLNCLEHNSSFADVQDAALGAFNQLSSGM